MIRIDQGSYSRLSRSSVTCQTFSAISRTLSLVQRYSYSANTIKRFIDARYQLDELETRKGVLQLVKGLAFLHQNTFVHGNLSPQSIYITPGGDWKLSGFDFTTKGGPVSSEYMHTFPFFCAPALEYLAPEYILDQRCDSSSDVFSLGCVLYAISGGGKSPLECDGHMNIWREKIAGLGRVPYFNIGGDAANLIRRMIVRNPGGRIGLGEVEKSSFFDSVLVNTITFLDSFAEKGIASLV